MQNLFKFRTDDKSADKNILRMIVPSVIGIIICMACLCGTTWAWFTGQVTSGATVVRAANYAVESKVTYKDSVPAAEVEKNADGGYTLEADKAYTVLLTINGTAVNTAGYCKVTLPGGVYYTPSMTWGDTLTFHITGVGGNLSVLGFWGTYSGDATITEGDTITGAVSGAGQELPDHAGGVTTIDEESAAVTTSAQPDAPDAAETTASADTTDMPQETTAMQEQTTQGETGSGE